MKVSSVCGTRSLSIDVKVLDRPGPPGKIAVSNVTANSADLKWSLPKDNGGDEVTHYVVEKRETSRLAWTTIASDVCDIILCA